MPMHPTTIITGVSRGLGAALFAELSARGDRILAIGRNFTAEQQELAAAEPDRVTLRSADLADLASLPEAAELGTFLHGRSAGSDRRTGPGRAAGSDRRTGPGPGRAAGNPPDTDATDTHGTHAHGTHAHATDTHATDVEATVAGPMGINPVGTGGADSVERAGSGGAGTREIVLVHNAALVGPIGAVGEVAGAELAASVAVNLTGPMVLTNAVLAAAAGLAQVRLDILYISSGAAHRVIGGWGAYCATKAGGEMFFNVLAEQYAADPRVRVANVDPGQMDTMMQADIRGYRAAGAYFPGSQRWQDAFEEDRLVAPAEVAKRIIRERLTHE
jgi:NAD(P)-dependent dehydrogenase (short-subunit alcohol dehydrogenase family)